MLSIYTVLYIKPPQDYPLKTGCSECIPEEAVGSAGPSAGAEAAACQDYPAVPDVASGTEAGCAGIRADCHQPPLGNEEQQQLSQYQVILCLKQIKNNMQINMQYYDQCRAVQK